MKTTTRAGYRYSVIFMQMRRVISLLVLILLAGLIATQDFVPTVSANAGDDTVLTSDAPPSQNSSPEGVHTFYIRKSSSEGDARLQLYGYWLNNSSGHYFSVYQQGSGMTCDVAGSGDRVETVTVTVPGDSATYNIRGANKCAGDGTHVNKDTSAAADKIKNNVFYGRYPLPAVPAPLPKTSYYYAAITVQMGSDANQESSLRALVSVDGRGSLLGQAGQTGENSETARANTKYPIVARASGNAKNTSFTVPFGMTCGSDSGDKGVKELVTLYDADNGSQFDNTVTAQVKDETANQLAPLTGPTTRGTINADKTIFTPGDGERSETSFYVIMQANHHYKLRVNGVDGNGSSYVPNYVSIGLPFDSIYGYADCQNPSYNLTPKVTASPSNVGLEANITYSGEIDNSGGKTDEPHPWRVDVIRFAPGVNVPMAAQSNSANAQNCSAFSSRDKGFGTAGCKMLYSDPGGSGSSYPQKSGDQFFSLPNDSQIGTHYCFVTSVQQPTPSDAGVWGHSKPVCVEVGVYPSVQFLGYDVRVGGPVVAHPSTIGRGTYGSWGEFGVFSRGVNTGFASGAGLAGNSGSSSSSQRDWSSLTFANCRPTLRKCSMSNYFGNFGNTIMYPSNIVAGLANLCNGSNTVPDGTIISPNNTITGTKYICSNGTVTIGGDQTYASANTSDDLLPQQIIIANGIRIASRVQTVNSWLVATGTTIGNAQKGSAQGGVINTCSDATTTTKLTTSICSKQLMVVGPVITKELDLLRTYYKTNGATYNPAVSAETFNLRADAFLWAYRGKGNGMPIAQTTSVTDLPPRF